MRATQTTATDFSVIRFGIFLLNFAVSSFFMISCVIGLIAGDTPGAFFGSVVAIIPFTVYSLCEWVAGYRKNLAMERRLGWANLVFAAFVAFGVVANVGEALLKEEEVDAPFLLGFILIGTLFVAYLAYSGWMRLRWTHPLNGTAESKPDRSNSSDH